MKFVRLCNLWHDWFRRLAKHSYLRCRNSRRKGGFIKLQTCIIGFALCLMMSSAGYAKPREVIVADAYDGLQYHFSEKVAQAVVRDKKSNLFRIIVVDDGPTSGWSVVSALYNRKQRTLKIHSYSDWLMVNDEAARGADLARRSHTTVGWLYRNVNDTKLRKLAAMNKYNYIFGGNDPSLTKLGIRGHQLYKKKSYWECPI